MKKIEKEYKHWDDLGDIQEITERVLRGEENVRELYSAIRERLAQENSRHDKERTAEVVEKVEGMRFVMNVDKYLPLVERWNKTDYDTPFDDGYEQFRKDLLTTLRSPEGEEENTS